MHRCVAFSKSRLLTPIPVRWFATDQKVDHGDKKHIPSTNKSPDQFTNRRNGQFTNRGPSQISTRKPGQVTNKKYALTENRKQYLQQKAKIAKKLYKRKQNALLNTRPVPTSRLQMLQNAVVDGDAKTAYEIAEKLKPSVSKFDQLLCVCAKNGKVRQAFKTFNDMKKASIRPTIFTFNYMINAIAEAKGEGAYFERADWLIGEMDRFHVKMNIATLNVFLKVCINHGHPEKAIQLCENMEAQEIEPDLVTYSLWISAHKKRLDKENPAAVPTDAIHKMEDNQIVTNKTRAELKPIFEIYDAMTKRNILPHVQFFNTWLQICKNSSGPSLVFEVFAEMKKCRVKADFRTYDILLSVCAQTNRIEYGMDLFKTILHSNMPVDTQLSNSLLRLPHVVYFNAQTSTEHDKLRANQFLEQVLEMMDNKGLRPNLDTYQLLLSIYGRQENMDKVNGVFSQLEAQGLKPTIKIYTALLAAFRQTQQVEPAQNLYRSLVEKKFPMDGVFLRLLLKIMKGAKRMDYAEEIVQRLRTQEEEAMAPRLAQVQEQRDEEADLRAQGKVLVEEYAEHKRIEVHNREQRKRRLEREALRARERGETGREGEESQEGREEEEREEEERQMETKREGKGAQFGRREKAQQTTYTTTDKNLIIEEPEKEKEREEESASEIDAEAQARRATRQNAKVYSRNEDEVFTPEINDTLMKMAIVRLHSDKPSRPNSAKNEKNEKTGANAKNEKKAATTPKEVRNLATDLESEIENEPQLPLQQLRMKQLAK